MRDARDVDIWALVAEHQRQKAKERSPDPPSYAAGLPSNSKLLQSLERKLVLEDIGLSNIDPIGSLNSLYEEIESALSCIEKGHPLDGSLLLTKFSSRFEAMGILLGDRAIRNLNIGELALLTCSLIAKEWGFVLSTDERRVLCDGVPGTNTLGLLPTDILDFTNFAKSQGRKKAGDGAYRLEDFNLQEWCNFARPLIGSRSGLRAEAFFKKLGRMDIGKSLRPILASLDGDIVHTLALSVNEPVGPYSANLRVLALYLRIADHFCLTAPFTSAQIWKLLRSKTIDSVSCARLEISRVSTVVHNTERQTRRVIIKCVTDAPQLEVVLQDLKDVCDREFEKICDALAERPRSDPGLTRTEWRIESDGFEPIHARFEFDREPTLQILGAELYHKDPYVFIRELVQNSRDAILLRQHLLGDEIQLNGHITISTDRIGGTIKSITVTDNGIGMTNNVIKNYLARIGESYYRSHPIAKGKANFISRFGIGFLSCFMVAAKVEVQTTPMPFLDNENDGGVHIEIEDFARQFLVRKARGKPVGTAVKVYIDSSKFPLPPLLEEGESRVINFAKYVFGKIGVKLVVRDNGAELTIPAQPTEESLGERLYTHPVLENSSPSEALAIKSMFEQISIPISGTCEHGAFSGAVTFLTPLDEEVQCIEAKMRDKINQGFLGGLFRNGPRTIEIKWPKEGALALNGSPSTQTSVYGSLYLNGILVPMHEIPPRIKRAVLPPPRLTAFLNSQSLRTKLSRLSLESQNIDFSHCVSGALISEIEDRFAERLRRSNPRKRFFLLSHILTYYQVEYADIMHLVEDSRWPLLVWRARRGLKIYETGDIKPGTKLLSLPNFADEHLHHLSLEHKWRNSSWPINRESPFLSSLCAQTKIDYLLIDRPGRAPESRMPASLIRSHHLTTFSASGLGRTRNSIFFFSDQNCLMGMLVAGKKDLERGRSISELGIKTVDVTFSPIHANNTEKLFAVCPVLEGLAPTLIVMGVLVNSLNPTGAKFRDLLFEANSKFKKEVKSLMLRSPLAGKSNPPSEELIHSLQDWVWTSLGGLAELLGQEKVAREQLNIIFTRS